MSFGNTQPSCSIAFRLKRGKNEGDCGREMCVPFTWDSTATVCIGSATPLAVTTYGTETRFTVVTLTGTVGWRGGSFLEQAAPARRTRAAMRAARVRVLIYWLGSEVDATRLNPRRTERVCRRVRLIHRRRGRVARVRYTIASATELAARRRPVLSWTWTCPRCAKSCGARAAGPGGCRPMKWPACSPPTTSRRRAPALRPT